MLRKSNWLTGAEVLLWLAIVFCALFFAASAVTTLIGAFGGSVAVPIDVADNFVPANGLPAGVTVLDPVVSVPVGPWQAGVYLAGSLVSWLVVYGAIVPLLLAVRSASNGQVFTAANVRRIRFVGLTLVAGPLAASIASSLASLSIAFSVFGPNAAAAVVSFKSLHWIFVGVVVMVIAEIFQHGKNLRDELDQVV